MKCCNKVNQPDVGKVVRPRLLKLFVANYFRTAIVLVVWLDNACIPFTTNYPFHPPVQPSAQTPILFGGNYFAPSCERIIPRTRLCPTFFLPFPTLPSTHVISHHLVIMSLHQNHMSVSVADDLAGRWSSNGTIVGQLNVGIGLAV